MKNRGFGDSELGQGLGCAAIIFALMGGLALISYVTAVYGK